MFIDYGEYCDEYDLNYTGGMSNRENLAIKRILDEYIFGNYSVLDVGCGTCFTLDICDFINRMKYVGIEVSDKMSALAKEKYPKCNIINRDINDIDLNGGDFDIALSTFSIPYIGLGAIDKIYDSMRDGGLFIAVYYDKPYLNEDSVYHHRRIKYKLTVKPLVKRFIRKATDKFEYVLTDEPLTNDNTYRVAIFMKKEKKEV